MNYFVSHLQFKLLFVLLLITNSDAPIRVLSQLNQFDQAPHFTLPRLASPEKNVELDKLGRPVVLIFGEPYNQRTLESLTDLKKAYESVGLTAADLNAFLIISHRPDQKQMTQLHEKDKIKVEILLDEDLKVFGDYGIVVLPSVVVIDKEGRVDLAVSGLPLSFTDMISNAILLSTDRITQQQYETIGYSSRKTNAQPESVTKAHRLTNLAGQLAKRGLTKLALERYRDALGLDKSYLPAMMGTARCLVKMKLLPDAMDELQKILKIDPDYIEATLVTVQIEIMRGGDDIEDAKEKLQRILTVTPDHPEANYLMGMAYEAQGQSDHAMEHYKKAAERLLETITN